MQRGLWQLVGPAFAPLLLQRGAAKCEQRFCAKAADLQGPHAVRLRMPLQHDNDNEPIPIALLVLARLADAVLALSEVEEVVDNDHDLPAELTENHLRVY